MTGNLWSDDVGRSEFSLNDGIWREVGGFILVMGLLVAGAIGLGLFLSSQTCHSKAGAMGLKEVSWGTFQGCIVRFHGELIPLERVGVRVLDTVDE